jgi:hypothetical protein
MELGPNDMDHGVNCDICKNVKGTINCKLIVALQVRIPKYLLHSQNETAMTE